MTVHPLTIIPPSFTERVEDRALLAAFAGSGDERAFSKLVGRHAGLVYHTALRRPGDAQLAEEVAQNTFALMGRKAAKLTGHPFPAGWLHRTALWLAGDAAARENAHRRRMKRFAETAALHAAGNDPLESALPHLDKALDSLRESDRRITRTAVSAKVSTACHLSGAPGTALSQGSAVL